MELLLAAVGLAVAVWMIVSARKRHREEAPEEPPKKPPAD